MNREEPLISIIVPVYKAEKYLGYCLNSILSQTYTNWEAILVDDGSPDNSIEIMRQYQQLDPRFFVYQKENGGVSSARNFGLKLAKGDYLEFVDSDDCLSRDALEKQVSLVNQYQCQLVVTDALIVDFSAPEKEHIRLTSEWLAESPCCLSQDAFRQQEMRLIWFTALLEGPLGKLYDASLWRKLNLKFPEDISLGEDFLTNMKFYHACEKITFLREVCYYYNNISGSDSLSNKYREDLFEVKMYLQEKLTAHLGGVENLSPAEKDAFYCYAASSGLTAVEATICNSQMEDDRLVLRITQMLTNKLFYESIMQATWIPERFQTCLPLFKKFDIGSGIEKVRNPQPIMIAAQEECGEFDEQKQKEITPTLLSEPEKHPGILNRVIRRILRWSSHFGGEVHQERMTRWEGNILEFGLKESSVQYIRRNRYVTRNVFEHQMIDLQQNLLQYQHEYCREAVDTLRGEIFDQIHSVSEKTEQSAMKIKEISTEIPNMKTVFVESVQESSTVIQKSIDESVRESSTVIQKSIGESIQESSATIQKNINDYTWISEQRMSRYAYLRDINELRQKKKALMLATAEHGNIGDAAITLAEQEFLLKYYPEYYQVEISTYEFSQKEAFLHAIVNPEDILFINGGGNIGDMYPEEEELHRKIVAEFPNNQIIILPQTISFSKTTAGEAELQKSAYVYNHHKHLRLYVRGNSSLEIARTYFSSVECALMPDMVHMLKVDYAFIRDGALLCLREDQEAILDGNQKIALEQILMEATGNVEYRTNMYSQDITREERGMVVRQELMRFASHRIVVTDRLHGMIFSAITGTPCVALLSCNHKLREYYDAFFQDAEGIFLADSPADILSLIQKALTIERSHCPILEKESYECVDNRR